MASLYDDVPSVSEDVRMELALASRILAKQGVVDAFGHCSTRHPGAPHTHFLMSANKAPALTLPSDIQVYRIDNAEPINKKGPRGFIERYIHASLYARFKPEDVSGVVHCHAMELLPFGICHILPFKAAVHTAGFLGHHPAPIFDLFDVVGEHNDCLVRDRKSGDALAKMFDTVPAPKKKGILSFGKKPIHVSNARACVLMRGHGATIVGHDLRNAVMRAVYTRNNARVLTSLHGLLGGIPGLNMQHTPHQGVIMLGETEGELAAASNATQVDRAWNVWVSEVADGIPGASGMQPRASRQSYDTGNQRQSYDEGAEWDQQTSRSYSQSPVNYAGTGANLSSYPPRDQQAVQRSASQSRPQGAVVQQQQQQPQRLSHAQQVDVLLNSHAPVQTNETAPLQHTGASTAAPVGGFGGNANLSRGNSLAQRDYASEGSQYSGTNAGHQHHHGTAAAEPGAANVGTALLANRSSAQPHAGHHGGQGATDELDGNGLKAGVGGASGLDRSGSVLSHSTICPHCQHQLA